MELRVQHIPQIPCKAFHVNVNTLEEARKTMDILADYDLFQLENDVKPDFCNAQGLEYFDEEEQERFEWYDDETGLGIKEYFDEIKVR